MYFNAIPEKQSWDFSFLEEGFAITEPLVEQRMWLSSCSCVQIQLLSPNRLKIYETMTSEK